MPKSRSGPVRVIRTFEPTPPTKEQEYARLLHKRALIQSRIDERRTFLATFGGRQFGKHLASSQLVSLENELNDLENALSRFGE